MTPRDELLDKYLQNSASPQELEEIKRLLKDDPAFAKAFVEYVNDTSLMVRVAAQMESSDQAQGRESARLMPLIRAAARKKSARLRARSKTLLWSRALTVAAACLLISAGLFWYSQYVATQAPEIIATLTTSSPGVTLLHAGAVSPTAAVSGVEILNGDTVSVPPDGRASLSYTHEQTTIVALAGADLKLWQEAQGKRAFLPRGSIECSVARQPRDKPLVIETPTAIATVVGTRLSVMVDKRVTRLEVTEGKVRLENAADKSKFADVAAGQYAVVDPDQKLAAGPLAANAVLVAPSPAKPAEVESVHPGYFTWKHVRIGAGGWLTGCDIAPDGTKVVRTDTYGAYIWDAPSLEWRQLVTNASMPAEDVKPGWGEGVYEICIAPSNSKRIYMFFRGGVYRSDDSGSHWKRTAFTHGAAADANDAFRMLGEKMVVDPANPDVVYAGTPNTGVFVTTDGGEKWQAVRAIPVSKNEVGKARPGHAGIAFDSSSGVSGGRTKVIFIPSWGNGIWRSEDAGAAWTQICGEDSALGTVKVDHGAVSSSGVYYVTEGAGQRAAWKYSKGVWERIYPAGKSIHSLALDPVDSEHIIVGNDAGVVDQSFDGGKTWTGLFAQARNVSDDVPWLAWTDEPLRSNGAMRIEPLTHELFFARRMGVWKANLPKSVAAFDWISQSKGIEQFTALGVAAPPGGKPVFAQMDVPLFYDGNLDIYPAAPTPLRKQTIAHGWALDYASSDPSFIAAIVNIWNDRNKDESCYSTDGGKTWAKFSNLPNWSPWPIGGSIAASTPSNFIWGPANKKPPCYTKDGGKTWTKISIPGIAEDDDGWSSKEWFNRQFVAADRVSMGTFYMYHVRNGLYRSTDGGDNWQLVHKGELAPWSGFNAKLKSVPGQSGHLFFTAGSQGSATDQHPVDFGPFIHSEDGGSTWTPVLNVLEVLSFGFGKEAPGSTYPTIYIAGWVNKEWGIWESDDEAKSWKKIGDFPTGSMASINAIDGDKTVYGKVYVGLAGNGWAYGVAEPPAGSR